MTPISRRKLLSAAAFSLAESPRRAHSGAGAQVTLEIPAQATGAQMPVDFLGLSYEVQQLTDPSFFALAQFGTWSVASSFMRK